MRILVLNIDDSLAQSLEAFADRSHQPLSEWVSEQLARLAEETERHHSRSAWRA